MSGIFRTALALAVALPLAAAPLSGRAETPKAGGSLTVWPGTASRSLISAVDTSGTTIVMAAKYLETLVTVRPDGSFAPKLAEAYTVSDDGLTWTFNLRRDVKWHDGKPFVASDVQWNIEHVWKGPLKNIAFGAIGEVVTPDEHTVTFRLTEPVAPGFVLTSLAQNGWLLAPQGFPDGNLRESPQNSAPTGTGPFRFKEYARDQYVVLERNPDYWGEPARLDTLIFRFFADPNAGTAAFEAGEVDLVIQGVVPLFDLPRLRGRDDVTVSDRGYEAFQWKHNLELNVRRPPLNDQKVRHAIAHAIDQRIIVQSAYLGNARPGISPVPSVSAFHNPDVPRYPYDPNRANELLDQAGLPRGADGTRFSLTLLVPPGDRSALTRSGQYIQQALKQVGIDVKLENVDWGGLIRQVYTDHSHDGWLGYSVDVADPCIATTYWFSTDGIIKGVPFRNGSGISDPALDAVIDRACKEVDPAKRKAALFEFQDLVMEKLPMLQLAELIRSNVYKSYVKEVGNSPNWFFDNWADLWVDK